MADDPGRQRLRQALETIHSVLRQFLITLSAVPSPTYTLAAIEPRRPTETQQPTDPLALLYTSATLTKAHTTKLTLLIVSPPFTPAAISTVLHDLATGSLPAMMTAAETCTPETWGKEFSHEVHSEVRRLLGAMFSLVSGVIIPGSSTTANSAARVSSDRNRGRLASTGVIWEACDALVALQKKGPGGLAVEKANLYRDMLKDAIAELREWSDEVPWEESLREYQPILPIPAIRPLLQKSIKHLSLLSILYNALLKHRLRPPEIPIPPPLPIIQKLNTFMTALSGIPDAADEIVNSFYDNDAGGVRVQIEKCGKWAREAVAVLEGGWAPGEVVNEGDTFITWARQWENFVEQGEKEMGFGSESDQSGGV